MAQTRLVAIMKTDIRGFTNRVSRMSAIDLSDLLGSHKRLITQVVKSHGGQVIKGEGDAFWIVFESVTRAALAGMEIQEELRIQQSGKGDDERLAVRIVITAGDVLFRDNDIFGEAVNLAARIEGITPADEIYLSRAADLALNHAEVRTQPVGEFMFKGFEARETVLRIDRQLQTRIIRGHTIVYTDLQGARSLASSNTVEDMERILRELEIVHRRICEEQGGTTRLIMGDAYLLSFPQPTMALAAVSSLLDRWRGFVGANERYSEIRIVIGIAIGDIYHYRSTIWGSDINEAARLQALGTQEIRAVGGAVLISGKVWEALGEDPWRERLIEVNLSSSGRETDSGRIFTLRQFS